MVNVAPDSMAISVLCIGVRALTETAPGVQFTGVIKRQGIEEKNAWRTDSASCELLALH